MKGLKRIVFTIVCFCEMLSAFGGVKSVSIVAYSRSLIIEPLITISGSSNETVSMTYLTTCDGAGGLPRHDTLPNGFVRVSDEARPNPAQPGIYEADYAMVSAAGELTEYGTLMLRLPTEDANGNGLPNFLERAAAANFRVSGNLRCDWPAPDDSAVEGILERAENEEGCLALTCSRGNGSLYFSGAFSAPYIYGTADYTDNPRQLTFHVSLVSRAGGTPIALTGSTGFMISAGEGIVLPPFSLKDAQNRLRGVASTALRRVDDKYAGDLEFADGKLETSWPDFTRWVVELSDPSDSNTNGVPDIADRAQATDSSAPVVKITKPREGIAVTESLLTIAGTAGDDVGVERVEWQLNSGAMQSAVQSGTAWSVSLGGLDLAPGTNLFVVRAYDLEGNASAPATRRLVYNVRSTLTVQINGSGSVTPYAPGKELFIGRAYSVKAQPAADYFFSDWSGDVSGSRSELSFVMQSNLVLQANFVPNPFIPLAGRYTGLFSEMPQLLRTEGAGLLRLTLGRGGVYSARVISFAKTNAFTGRFDVHGHSTKVLGRGSEALTIDLTGGDTISGSLQSANGASSQLLAVRSEAPANQSSFAGRYSLRVAAPGDGLLMPGGDGYAAATVSLGGALRLAGKLADGAPFTYGASLSRAGKWPLFVPLYKGKGFVMGWLECLSPPDIADSSVTWLRPPNVSAYSNGFAVTTPADGSGYDTNNSLLASGNALLVLNSTGFSAAVTNQLARVAPNKFASSDGSLVMALDSTSGTFSGTSGAQKFFGTLLQKQGVGAGFFLDAGRSGRATLQPAP